MNERVILRRLDGGRRGVSMEYPVGGMVEVLLGRDGARGEEGCARLRMDRTEAVESVITGVGAGEEVLVNRRAVVGGVRLRVGDVIQLGEGGPEFEYDFEPKAIGSGGGRVLGEGSGGAAGGGARPARPVARRAVTERRRIRQRRQRRQQMVIVALALLIAVSVLASYMLSRPRAVRVDRPARPVARLTRMVG